MSTYYRKAKPIPVVHRSMFSNNFLLLVFFITLFSLTYIVQRNLIKNMITDITQMQNRIELLKQENINLQKLVYKLSTNERIREIALRDLKMVEPRKPAKIIFYKDQRPSKMNKEMLSGMIDSENIVYQNPNILIHTIEE